MSRTRKDKIETYNSAAADFTVACIKLWQEKVMIKQIHPHIIIISILY